MKKRLLKVATTLLLLIVLFIPSQSVHAATPTYKFAKLNVSALLNLSGGTVSGSHVYFNITSSQRMYYSKHNGKYYTTIHEITTSDSKKYQAYCMHVGKQISYGASMTLHTGFSSIKNNSGNSLSTSQQTLLKNIVASGYQNGQGSIIGSVLTSGTSYRSYGSCKSETVCLKTVATQILIWEVIEGARTNYASAPNVYNGSNSAYNALVSKNSKLKTQYEAILADAYELTDSGAVSGSYSSADTAKNNAKILTWNDAKDRYESSTISIGDYSVSNKNGFTVETSNSKIVVSTTSKVTSAKAITLKLVRGTTTSNSTSFRWYSFPSTSGYQDILLGDYTVTYNRYMAFKTEQGKFTFSKVDANTGKALKGAKFELYKCNSSNKCTESVATIDLTSSTSKTVTIYKTGKYLIKETVTPEGYEKMPDTYITFSINSSGYAVATAISTSTGDTATIKAQSGAKYNLIAYNSSKSFTISKIDGRTSSAIKGATFQIYNSSGSLLKFNYNNGIYTYSTSGTVTDIVNSSSSEYEISALPAGEYVIRETAVPSPYVLSSTQSERETKIKIDSSYNLYVYNYTSKSYSKASNATVTIKNFTTKVIITKTGDLGAALPGVTFELYDSNKSEQIPVSMSSTGVYDYDSSLTTPIQLVTSSEEDSLGTITINNLPEGTYYLKEVLTLDGYTIDSSNEWTSFTVSVTRSSAPYVYKTISNAKGQFCFYKKDENGNYLNDGKFKIQIYNESTSKYEDVPLIYNSSTNTYSIDETKESSVYTFTPVSNGETCFTDVSSSTKYKIVEIEAPEGFVLPKASEAYVEISINENGYASGNAVLINTEVTTGEGAEAQAELVINISTGQTRIRYAIIISVLLVLIIGLIILNRKIGKK